MFKLYSMLSVLEIFLLCLKGRTFGSSRMGSLKSRACVSMASWDDTLYGQQPTTLPLGSGVNYRPLLLCEGNVFRHWRFSRLSVASKSVMVLSHRYVIGIPVELWCENLFECFGLHSYIPLERWYSHWWKCQVKNVLN